MCAKQRVQSQQGMVLKFDRRLALEETSEVHFVARWSGYRQVVGNQADDVFVVAVGIVERDEVVRL